MTAPNPIATTQKLLVPEAALAARIIRNGHFPRNTLLWLSAPAGDRACPAESGNEPLVEAIREIITPLLESATSWEKQQTAHAAEWLSVLLRYVADTGRTQRLSVAPRLLAANLLPIYRSLATGKLHEGFEQSRHRLFETACLVALFKEWDSDLVEFMEQSLPTEQSPHQAFAQRLKLNLVALGCLVRKLVGGFDETTGEFDPDSIALISNVSPGDVSTSFARTAGWADPELLWRLGGELLADKDNLVLPRAWIDTPVPWKSIGEHWHKLWFLLSHSSNLHLQSQHEPNSSHPRKLHTALSPTADPEGQPQTHWKGVGNPGSGSSKVLVAEVLSHNDPAFVGIIRRQLSVCRKEVRVIAMASIVVLAEDGEAPVKPAEGLSNGMQPWQKTLVNVISNHPDVSEPFTFLTASGELLLCVMDVERSHLSSLLRESLSLAFDNPEPDASLSKVITSGRYFVGISAVSTPFVGLTPEDLIEASRRCLTAACSQRKATIKSIEVY